MTGKLTVDAATGHVTGPARITYNDPFPCQNGNWGSGVMAGVLMHTMVSELPSAVSWFNDSRAQASAHFGIAEDGEIHQFGPVGKGWIAWHAAEANRTWYGIEHADNGNPGNPLTAAQITASAQLVECLSAFAGFPLQISDSPSVKGYGWHGMGGAAFGGHFQCPGDVRKAQRPQILALAMSIRQEKPVTPPQPSVREWLTAGELSLHALAAQQGTSVSAILRLTAEHSPNSVFPGNVADYVNAVFQGTADPSKPAPAGLQLYMPA
jgi:hypothetical protein